MSEGFKITLWSIAIIAIFMLAIGASDSNQAPKDSRPTHTTEVVEAEPEPLEFMGYECTDDCSGHEAGYDWAYENDVCDEYFDGGHSESFAEGVRAYAEENC